MRYGLSSTAKTICSPLLRLTNPDKSDSCSTFDRRERVTNGRFSTEERRRRERRKEIRRRRRRRRRVEIPILDAAGETSTMT
jgi:hypothetical protein